MNKEGRVKEGKEGRKEGHGMRWEKKEEGERWKEDVRKRCLKRRAIEDILVILYMYTFLHLCLTIFPSNDLSCI